jgi:hypothetical protein
MCASRCASGWSGRSAAPGGGGCTRPADAGQATGSCSRDTRRPRQCPRRTAPVRTALGGRLTGAAAVSAADVVSWRRGHRTGLPDTSQYRTSDAAHAATRYPAFGHGGGPPGRNRGRWPSAPRPCRTPRPPSADHAVRQTPDADAGVWARRYRLPGPATVHTGGPSCCGVT